MDEVLAFVEGSLPSIEASVQSSALRLSDPKIRRISKRREATDGDQQLSDSCNGDTSIVESTVTCDHICSVTRPNHLNGFSTSRSKRGKNNAQLVVNSNTHARGPGSGLDDWLTSEMANHLMVHDDFDSDLLQKKEKEFVLVQKKRKQKIITTISAMNANSRNGLQCDEQKTFVQTNGFIHDVLKTNGIIVSRNSSELSFPHSTHSTGSDIDDLSHFAGEDQETRIFDAELFVDASLPWENEKDESCASVMSLESCDEILPRFTYLTERVVDWNVDVAKVSCSSDEIVDVKSDEDKSIVDDGTSPCEADCIRRGDNDRASLSPDDDCAKPDVSQDNFFGSPLQLTDRHFIKPDCVQAVTFLDAAAGCTMDNISELTFTFGCTLSSHLSDDCNNCCKGWERSSNCGNRSYRDNSVDCHAICAEPFNAGSAHLDRKLQLSVEDCSNVSFIFNDPTTCSDVSVSCLELHSPSRALHSDVSCSSVAADDRLPAFRITDAQAFLYGLFEDVWSDLLQGETGVVVYSGDENIRPQS